MNKIEDPLFIDLLIRDTLDNKIQWDTSVFDYGLRHETTIGVPGTVKYLKLEIFDMGRGSFIKTDFYTSYSNHVHFDNIKSKDQYEKVTRLLKVINK